MFAVAVVMLTRRDKLLNRPWQLRRYNNHRYKVLNAVPAIDFHPPEPRNHVTCKLKKLQWEGERRERIEEDNFKLLQRMGSIMKKNRLENSWQTPPPNFLHRVGIYHRTRSPTPYQEEPAESPGTTGKRRNCSACTKMPSKQTDVVPEPEARVPWPPPKPKLSRRRSSSPAVKPMSDFDIPKIKSTEKKNGTSKSNDTLPAIVKISDKKPITSAKKYSNFNGSEKQLVMTQGSLKLLVNFPPFADVKIISGTEKRILQQGTCGCRSNKCAAMGENFGEQSKENK